MRILCILASVVNMLQFASLSTLALPVKFRITQKKTRTYTPRNEKRDGKIKVQGRRSGGAGGGS